MIKYIIQKNNQYLVDIMVTSDLLERKAYAALFTKNKDRAILFHSKDDVIRTSERFNGTDIIECYY